MSHTATPSPPEVLDIEVFRAGDYGARGQYADADLDAIAADYSPQRHEAPVTLDHRQEGPADGWVAALRRIGDRLVATLTQLSPRLRSLLASGAYRKRSVELYRAHRDTGRPYLKAVSFLGAAAPEVKGLADPLFAEQPTDTVTFNEERVDTPHEDCADTMRARLMHAGRWRPTWERAGLLDVFRALGSGPQSDTLCAVLLEEPAPVSFGAADINGTIEREDDLVAFVGEPSPQSIDRHHRALAFLATHPTANYAEALVQTAR
jgi:hypothetical protein